ncbi:nephrin-like [Eriocheir sinensis]|uniref:nephrin-like n=1 Tax=Eriocheir sinensis TaxID=95602 RepID=UPI0021C6FE68|nr:nephrin-like [Eriocheir sinensis]
MTSQTMMSLIQLHVHEEIRGLEIFDNDERLIRDEVGPLLPSSHLRLTCRAYGGYPSPEVRWVSGGEELMYPRIMPLPEGPMQLVSGRPVSVRSAVLEHPTLTRQDDGRKLRCEARSTNLTQGLHKEVTITMHLPPLKVEIMDVDKPLRAGVKAAVKCRSTGSKPPASITLTVEGSSRLETQPTQPTPDQNMTIRRGELWPTSEDNERMLVCTATNPLVPAYTLTAREALHVHFPPEVQVLLAPALDPRNIKEGEDVYFECHIRANPPENRVQWKHQGRPLYTVRERGVLAQGRNLVLQGVSRHAAGSYQCTATNAIATVTSAPAALDVMFAPECRQPSNVTVSVTAMDEVTLDCAVESNPEEVGFTWQVNSSRGVKELPATTFTSQGSTSRLVYRPQEHGQAHEQHGVVFCLASNKIGKQKEPCVFLITPAGPPEEPVSCSLVNHSATSLAVACVPGHDGGLRQVFLTTVQDAATQEVVANITSATPSFSVEGLASGRDYLLLVRAANEKGKSPPYIIQGFALKVAENKINNSRSVEASPLLAVFVGVMSGFVFILTVLAVAARSRCRRRCRQRPLPDACPDNNKLGGGDEAPPSPSTKASLDEVKDSEDEDGDPNTPESSGGLLEPREGTTQVTGSPTNVFRTTYVPSQTQQPKQQQQPLHPGAATSNHKYYKIKIDCTRLNNESFV